MTHTGLKPIFITNRMYHPLRVMMRWFSRRYYLMRGGYRAALLYNYVGRHIYIRGFFKQFKIGRRYFVLDSFKPHKADTILKFYRYVRVWQMLARRTPMSRRHGDWVARWQKKHRHYLTNESMVHHYFGEFVRNRTFMPFRWNTNKKKLDKLNRDLQKARRKRMHNIKEDRRLGKKARSIARVRKYGSTGPKQIRYWGPAVYHSEKKSGVSRRQAIRSAVRKKRAKIFGQRK